MEYTGGEWLPALNRKACGTGDLTLSAIYPLLPQDGNEPAWRDIAMPVDQSGAAEYEAADVLFASTEVGASSASAVLKFNHALHRINIHLKGNIPDDLTIEVKSLAGGRISLEDGTVKADGDAGFVWLKPYRQGSASYSIIILPQATEAFRGEEGLLRLTSGGKSVGYKFDSSAERFNEGMQTTLNLTLKKEEGSEADLEFSNQTRWVYGIKSPAFPGKENVPSIPSWQKEVEDGIWFRYSYENMSILLPYENQYLTWKEGCGWFDCNKTFKYQGDGNMCWAAAASNLIHWWMDQNREYIAAYDKKYGPEYGDLKRPEKYTRMTPENQQHSEVFNFFKSSFGNQGSWDTGGVNWFINGNDKNLIYCRLPEFHGFFSRVFSEDDTIATETRDTSKDNFNRWIKDAFRKNRAICFTAFNFAGPNTKRHSMVIWGAEFDAEGIVSNVYFCDNNYGEDEPNHGSLRRYKVEYLLSDVPEHQGKEFAYLVQQDYTDGTKPTARAEFTSLTLVDLRRDIWQKAFPEETMNNE